MRDCFFCGGTTEKKLVAYTKWYKGKLIAIENVPAEVCTQCGEQYFSPKIVEKLQKIVWSKTKPVKTINVPLYSLTAKAK